MVDNNRGQVDDSDEEDLSAYLVTTDEDSVSNGGKAVSNLDIEDSTDTKDSGYTEPKPKETNKPKITFNTNRLKQKSPKSAYDSTVQRKSHGNERPSLNDLRLKGVTGERIRRIVSDIIFLEKVNPSWRSYNAIDNIKKFHKFTIEQAVRIIKGLVDNGIEFEVSDYKIITEKPYHRYFFRDITMDDYEVIYGALTEYQCRLFRAIQALKVLKTKDDVIDVDYKIGSYLKVMAFTPKELHLFFSKMDFYKIDYKKSDFRISIKRDRDKEHFEELAEHKIKKIWPAMTDYQKEIYNDEYSNTKIPIDYNHNQ
jgi:hypothetical protein